MNADVEKALEYCREIFDECGNGEWAVIEQILHNQEAEIAQLRDKADKFKWQVRDTCTRAENAEALLRECLLCAAVSIHPATLARINAHLGATHER